MVWKTLLAAALVMPAVAYVAGLVYAPEPVPQRPAVVLPVDSGRAGVPPEEPRVTMYPRPDDDDRDDRRDERDDRDDDVDDDVDVVRPSPQDADEDSDDGGDRDDGDGDDSGDGDE